MGPPTLKPECACYFCFPIYTPPPRKDHPAHASDLQKIIDLMEKHELGKPAILGSFGNGPSSSGVGVAGGSGSCPSSASSGVVDAETPLQSGPRRSLRLVRQ